MRKFINLTCACFFACAALFSCGRAGESELRNAAERFRGGKANAREAVADALLKVATLKKFPKDAEAAGGLVYARGKEEIRALWPVDVTIDLAPGFNSWSVDPGSGRTAFTDGKEILLFDTGGSLEAKAVPNGAGRVSGLSVAGESVLFLQGGSLLEMDSRGGIRRVMNAAVTPPKLTMPVRAVFERSPGKCAVNCGNAGTYSLGVADLAGGKMLFRDMLNSSAKFGFDGNYAYCVTGASGGWNLVKRSVAAGRVDALGRFTKLVDVEFAPGVFAAMEEGSLALVDLATGESVRAPFAYGIVGQSSGKLVLSWKNANYLVDQRVMLDALKKLRAEIPALFAPSK